MNSPQFVFTTARCVSSGSSSVVGACRGSGSRGSGASTAVQPGHALARGLVVPAAAAAGDDERDREQCYEPQLQPASERQIEVTSAMYVSVSSLGAPPAFATAVGPAL